MDIKTILPIKLNIDRRGFARHLNSLLKGDIVGVELGVERGKFTKILLEEMPSLYIYAIDPLVPYKDYREHVTKEQMDGFYNEALEIIGNRGKFIRKFSLDAVKQFKDNTLDFVYIDANHDFLNTTQDLAHWEKKVKVGGVVSGHDYNNFVKEFNRCDVKSVLDAYTKAFNISSWYITNDTSPSWFWVKK